MPEDIKTNIEELELGLVGDEAEELDVEVEETVELDAVTEAEIPPTEEQVEESEEEQTEESAEEAEETEEEEQAEEGEEAESEEDIDEDDDEADGEEADPLEEALSVIESLKAELAEAREENKNLKKTNRKLSAKVRKELEKKEKFMATVKGISVELLPEEKEEETKDSAVNHGRRTVIGEI